MFNLTSTIMVWPCCVRSGTSTCWPTFSGRGFYAKWTFLNGRAVMASLLSGEAAFAPLYISRKCDLFCLSLVPFGIWTMYDLGFLQGSVISPGYHVLFSLSKVLSFCPTYNGGSPDAACFVSCYCFILCLFSCWLMQGAWRVVPSKCRSGWSTK